MTGAFKKCGWRRIPLSSFFVLKISTPAQAPPLPPRCWNVEKVFTCLLVDFSFYPFRTTYSRKWRLEISDHHSEFKRLRAKDIAEKSSILSRPWFKSLVGQIERNLQTKVDCEPSQNIMQCIKFCLWMFADKALKSAMSTQHLVFIQCNWIYQHKMALEQYNLVY